MHHLQHIKIEVAAERAVPDTRPVRREASQHRAPNRRYRPVASLVDAAATVLFQGRLEFFAGPRELAAAARIGVTCTAGLAGLCGKFRLGRDRAHREPDLS